MKDISSIATQVVDLSSVIQIGRGNDDRVIKYLEQFVQLIPERLEQLERAMHDRDRTAVRQILHQMNPQLQFFGLHQTTNPIRRLEHEYLTMEISEMEAIVRSILPRLHSATQEVENVLHQITED